MTLGISLVNRFFTISSITRVIAAGMLFYALKRHPYDYYTLLRWVTFGVAGYSAFLAFKVKKHEWGIILGLLALLFNPIFLVSLQRKTWAYIDVAAGILLLVSISFVQERLGIFSIRKQQ
jgi:hypothetical protein